MPRARKRTVEDCAVTYVWDHEQAVKTELRKRALYNQLVREADEYDEVPVHIGCTLHWAPDDAADAADTQRISFYATPCHLDGVRLWFRCLGRSSRGPTEGGDECDLRVGALYKPPHGHWFACRECWGLTYMERQRHDTAHYETALPVPSGG